MKRCGLLNAVLRVDITAIVLKEMFKDFEVAIRRTVQVHVRSRWFLMRGMDDNIRTRSEALGHAKGGKDGMSSLHAYHKCSSHDVPVFPNLHEWLVRSTVASLISQLRTRLEH